MMEDTKDIIDTISIKIDLYKRRYGDNPKWLIIDNATFDSLKSLATFVDHNVNAVYDETRFMGMAVAVAQQSQRETIEVR
jgi:hypothetical protein